MNGFPFRGSLSRAIAHPVAFWLRVALTLGLFSQCFAGRGQPRLWYVYAAILPLALLLIDPPFRRRQRNWILELWQDLSRPVSEARVYFAGFAFVAFPASFAFVFHPFYHIDSGDSWAVIPTAVSVTREGNAEVSEYVPLASKAYYVEHPYFQNLPYCVMRVPSGVYSRYPVGMTVFAVPVVAVGRLSWGELEQLSIQRNLDRWASVCVAMAVVMLFFRLAIRLSHPTSALVASWLFALGSAVFSTVSQSLWQHGGVMFGTLLILNLDADERRKNSWLGLVLVSFAIGLMFACRLSSGLLVAILLLGMVVREPRRAVSWGIAGAIGVLPWAVFYQVVYGTPLGPSRSQMVASGWTWNWTALAGVLFSPSRGLLTYQPWVLLSLVGLVFWRKQRQAWVWFIAAFAHMVLIASWACWWGGSCWGSRLLSEALPFLALLMLPAISWLTRRRWGWWLLGLLFVLSSATHFGGIWRFDLANNWNLDDERTLWNAPYWPALLR